MTFKTEIIRAINHINSKVKINDTDNKKDESEIQLISERVLSNFQRNSFDFSQTTPIILAQGNKKRFAKRF